MAKRKQRQSMATVNPEPGEAIVGNDDVATRAWKAWKDSRNHSRDWRQEAAECYDLAAGRQWTTEEEAALKEQLRPIVTFNRTGVVLDAVSGYEINGRQSISFLPREDTDTGAVQIETEAAKYFREQCDAEDEESDAFYDLLVCGLGVVEHRMDYDDDPEGMMKAERTDALEMGYDPAATKRNLSDRRWDIRGKWWDKSVAKAKFPDHDFESSKNIAGDIETELDNNKPIDRNAAAFYKDTGVGEEYDRTKDRVFILEFTWFENEPFISALNPMSGKVEETDPKTLKALNDKMAEIGQPPLKSVKRTRKVFKRAFVHGLDTLNPDDLEAPCPHKFHYQFMTGKRDRNKNIWYGLVRPMKDPQRWSNKFLSQTMHMINANAKGGILHEEGAFENVKDVENRMAKPGWRLQTRNGYLDKVKLVEPSSIPQNTFELMQFAIGSNRDVTGVNIELLGLADRDQPGILEHSRKQSAMAILAPFFNSLRRYHKEAGRLTLYFIKTFMSDGRKIRIAGQGQAKYVPLTNVGDFDKYDVVVDESPTSANSKEQTFAALQSILPMVMKAGLPVPPEVLDSIPGIPAQLVEKWKAMMGPKPGQQEAQKLEEQDKAADIVKKGADARLADAKADSLAVGGAVDMHGAALQFAQAIMAFINPQPQAPPGQPPAGGPPPMPPGAPPMPGPAPDAPPGPPQPMPVMQ